MTRWLPLLLLLSAVAAAFDEPLTPQATCEEVSAEASDLLAPAQSSGPMSVEAAAPRAPRSPGMGPGRELAAQVFHPPV